MGGTLISASAVPIVRSKVNHCGYVRVKRRFGKKQAKAF